MNNIEMLIPYTEKNYIEGAREKYTMAFSDKVVFDKFIQLVILEIQELQSALKDLTQLRTLEEARGVQLDIVGDILGQPRVLLDVDFLEFFGMEGNPRAHRLGDLFSNRGGIFFDLDERLQGSVSLDDETYRIMLKAKIAKNTTRGTPEEMMWYLNFIFGTSASFTAESSAVVIALISDNLTPQQVMLLSYINRSGDYDVTLFPKPIGVRMEYGFYDPDQSFAFEDIPTAKGFGDLSDPNADGGLFASLITT